MARLLSIDYGKRRCGIAVSDPLKLIAGGLCTVATHELTNFLKDYFQKEDVEAVVLGLPTQTSGQASENQQRVRQFAASFTKQFPHMPLHFYDERFTSVIAHRAMLEGGLKKSRRQDKALVDEISACIILEDYMQHHQ
ncbi:MAG: Holliday junction resolvase RuvX [Bacteroidaceae bacterium]|jgi:putative Holliday junction resolvase|nr:Holliday junction resolvase RuvX [Bacteroidaceae bacterium]MDY6249674.1 Holliday junction resolvase RuvX [Bacteroidaceae bacterium]